MRTASFRRALVPGVAALALALSGCSASNESDSGSSGDEADLTGTLSGGGASTQQAAMGAWAVGFQELHPEVTVNYDPIGSGGGRENFISGAFPFAGTDAYLSEDDGEVADATERCNGTDPIEIPDYISPIALAFNVDGVDELNLSPEAVAGIFAGEITSWDDEAIAKDNPGADLPGDRINAVHRSDESGTTENFTEYLDAVAPDQWDAGVVENWPTGYGGEAAKGTAGVVSAVKNGQNSIGYADASQTQDLAVANVGVGGEFVEPSAAAASKILEVSERVEGRSDVSMAVDLDRTTAEGGVYPIVLTSYLLACQEYSDQSEADLVKAYLAYVISDEGQQLAADEAGSAPLSDNLQEEANGIVENISAG